MPYKIKKPLNGYILVQIDTHTGEQKTTSGIILPEIAKEEEPTEGTVLQVADNVKQVKPGDRVHFLQYSGEVIDNQILMLEDDVTCVIEQ